MSFVITPPKAAVIPVRGSDGLFPVHRIYCVGRNYAAHTIEMGHDPDREDPFFFQKNPDNLLTGGADFPYPPQSNDVHHEIEMAVPLSPQEVDRKRDAIFKHESQKDRALFPGSDAREFWQRAEDRNITSFDMEHPQRSGIGNSKLESCVAGVVASINFPVVADGAVASVSYPFVMSQAGQ